MHQPGHQSLQQLALADHIDGFGTDARRQLVESRGGLARPDQPVEEEPASGEKRARDAKRKD
ncbi:MAG TPA: hypothetical protein VEM94_02800 [Candidatus Dormibacteraeota bacterium]|nr:hypothetical protein [Candidatus Dormibacteraeota bacterium]